MTEDEKRFFQIQRNFYGEVGTQKQVHMAVDKMPADVRAVAASILWRSVGSRLWGIADNIGGRDVVILSDNVPEQEIPALIGHETAHVVLHRQSGATVPDLALREAQAAALAQSWGFAGLSADVGGAVEDGLYGLWKIGGSDFSGLFAGLDGEYAQWAAGWGARAAVLWSDLENSFTANQRELFRKYQDSRSERALCDAWARGLGNRQPKPPPPPK